ncbi:hypothetical protein NFI96_006760 [Prochilodus magdalenae]|nr:hypothetical protein NFI96_006760 [Prochilodus magdalenae]
MLNHTNQLQDINQHGFKPAHSTETALIAVTERLHAARSAKLSSVLILLDLSAAFDTVNHKILLSVLTDLGITGTAWKWFKSYLEDCHYPRAFSNAPFVVPYITLVLLPVENLSNALARFVDGGAEGR